MPKVEFKNIVKQFGRVTVLEDLDLTVNDGEFLVLLGPSGCGKTTLLNLLAGLQEVTAGSITIGGRDVTDLDPKDRGLAMVFQSYALYPTKTVRGNLKFGLSAQRLDRGEIERRVAWAAQLLRIEPLLDRRPAQLSGGQRQRVAIGRALVKNVDVFLFDEPLSNLDAKLRTEMRLEIKKLHHDLKKTVVYVTHDQVEAMTMATRIAVMDGGVIQQIGTPDEIYERPANLFVARFVGSQPMNVFETTIDLTGNRVVATHRSTGVEMDLSDYSFIRQPATGMKVLVGLRPEHFSIGRPNGGKPAAIFDLPLRYSEKTGSDGTAFLAAADELLAVHVDHSQIGALRDGASVRAIFPADRFNLFDAETRSRI
ncbi:ABC transporter ATP-binding protein [Mesorhizobium sp. M0142]|uniref:ABC transporter ATP-binding protein n=1 Tax=unclassified Mesorhizobium TaxID=325217 RepID=UPI00333A82C2